jgi:pyruvate dehydrogenase E2 component (dihydrolipoamide acetyltransferase)
MIEFRLPSLGADMDQGTLLEWRVRPGDVVRKGDVIAVVDTTKAALDVECWQAGKVHDLLVQPGQTIAVGTPMARLLEAGEDAASIPPPAAAPGASAAAPPAAGAPPLAAAAPTGPAEHRHAASPVARRRAAELGVALDSVTGSGPHGVVTLKDVEQASGGAGQPRDRSAEIRRTIAAAMSRSKREVPHYYLTDQVPLAAAAAWVRQTNEGRPVTERLLMAALYLRAVACSAVRHPAMNGFFVDGTFRPSAVAHVGMAISLRGGGLIAPGIHAVDQMTLTQAMQALADLVARARAGRLRREELAEPTITLTNLGDQSVDAVHGIIYAPQVAIVGFGKVAERPWVVGGQVVPTAVVTLTLAADHRVSDGHAGARFLAEIAGRLQHPESL